MVKTVKLTSFRFSLKPSWVKKNQPLDKISFDDEVEVVVGGPNGRVLGFRKIEPEDRIAILDDVISTGETIRAVVSALRVKGARVSEVFVIVTKGNSYMQVEEALDIRVHSLVNLTETGELL